MPGRSFAEVLDDVLGPPIAAAGATPAPRRATVQPAHPLLFFRIPTSIESPAALARPAAGAPNTASQSTRNGRLFTGDERRALDTLIALGATLPPDFTASDLRRQYRLLARRVHPDRHPTARPDERMRLSQAFAAATDCYRLLSAIATAH